MTLSDLERQNRGVLWIFWPFWPVRVYIIHKVAPRRWLHTRVWPMCIMVLMGRVQMICDFRNYNYWTGNAIGFRASRDFAQISCFFLLSMCFPICHRKRLGKTLKLSRVSGASRSRPASRKLQRLVSVSAQKVSCTSLCSTFSNHHNMLLAAELNHSHPKLCEP